MVKNEKSNEDIPVLLRDVQSKIIVIREQNVIVDADVACLYGVETKRINEAVRNNPDKFPSNYMFQLSSEETQNLRTKFSSTKFSAKSRCSPKVFTETESSLELSFFIGKLKHTVKRVKKR